MKLEFLTFLSLLLFTQAAQFVDPAEFDSWLAKIDEIVNIKVDIALRNEQVSLGYFYIGNATKALFVTDEVPRQNVQGNWPTIATWASNSVGISIRKQTLARIEGSVLASFPAWLRTAIRLVPSLLQFIFSHTLETTAKSLAWGNMFVFHEIGQAYARFGSMFGPVTDTAHAEQVWLDYANVTFDKSWDQTKLQSAMRLLFELRYNPPSSATEQDQQLLLSNLRTGLHEQIRLQPAIEGAFPPRVSFKLPPPIYRRLSFDPAPMITVLMGFLAMPEEFLWLHKDLPPRPSDNQYFPSTLETLTLPDLVELYKSLTPGIPMNSCVGTAAENWTNLTQRMAFVAPLFRRNADDRTLDAAQCAPFTASQQTNIWQGVLPEEKNICVATCCEKVANGRSDGDASSLQAHQLTKAFLASLKTASME